ncbi:MAG: YdbL family protein [Terrimicrobiaceae bacterium]|nr:YdbL family protein [Terrimicrobiaceae bacterium]
MKAAGFFGLAALVLTGCQAPSVNLATPEPIKVDIAMRVDVYQHGGSKPQASSKPAAAADPALRRKGRMAEIQDFKNQRLVGENREGLLSVVKEPEGAFGDYVRRTVEAENADRIEEMSRVAAARKLPITEIQRQQAELWRARAFEGELIEVEEAPGRWTWQPKAGN